MSATDELRIAVVYRADLEMPRGKSEVQFGHAVGKLLSCLSENDLADYDDGSQMKLSLEVDNADELEAIMRRAAMRCVRAVKVVDAGRTVFGEPTMTCIGLGPMNKTDCNALTRNARLRA